MTPRELEVDALRATMTLRQIAHALNISRKTVETHIASLNRKKQVEKLCEQLINAPSSISDGSGTIGTGPVWGMQ